MENNLEKEAVVANPREYVYENGKKVEIEGQFLLDLIAIFDKLIKDEIKTDSKFKYSFINDAGNIVKNPKQKDIEEGKVRKILDFDRTIVNPTFEYSITEKGVAYAELKNFLESIHYQNIKNNSATHISKLSTNTDEQK